MVRTNQLRTLLVFKNTTREELIRSVHVYQVKYGKIKEVEREFLFSESGSYGEIRATPILILQKRFCVSEVSEGFQNGVWLCIFAFHSDHKPQFSSAPSLLLVYSEIREGYQMRTEAKIEEQYDFPIRTPSNRKIDAFIGDLLLNPKLRMIPTLLKDLRVIYKLEKDKDSLSDSPEEECHGNSKDCQPSRKVVPVFEQDLNCLPYEDEMSDLPDNKLNDETVAGSVEKKKRAPSNHIAKITLSELVKYFDMPIVEASRKLNVGLTVLKRKCREFGIPRWPHRKIKSLDCLIHDLQEEAKNQKSEDRAAVAMEKQRMLESEKETIERRPFMDIQSETKRLRQDVFKKRHRARALVKHNPTVSSNKT